MAIKTFTDNTALPASDINTFLANSGLVYITGASFSGVANVSVNSCFSATYDHYKLIVANVTKTVAGALIMRYRTGGVDNANAEYNYAQVGLYTNGTGANNSANNDTLWNLGTYTSATGTYLEVVNVDIYNPFTTGRTYASGFAIGFNAATFYRTQAMTQYGTYSFDGFTISPAAGTMAGKYAVYGYRIA